MGVITDSIDETNRNSNGTTKHFTAFISHSIGYSHCGYASWLRYTNDSFCMPSKLVQILRKSKKKKEKMKDFALIFNSYTTNEKDYYL